MGPSKSPALSTPSMTLSTRDEQLSQVGATASMLSGLDRPDHFMASESLVQDANEGNFLQHSLKTRFTSSNSAIAFPRSLGWSLGLEDPPRLHVRTKLHFREPG